MTSRKLLTLSTPAAVLALLVWAKVAPEITVTPTPPVHSQFYDHGRGATLDQVRGVLQEYLAIVGYWRRGWI